MELLRASAPKGAPTSVDREAGIIYGYVLAQEGPFKSEGRGEFDAESLRSIVSLGNTPKGLKSRLGHPTMSEDGIGKFLGRSRNLRIDKANDARTGKMVSAVRGDLHFDESASKTPNGDLRDYVLTLATSDAESFSSSLVLEVKEEWRRKKDGTLEVDQEGNELPPLWRPTAIHASDVVDTGDAVDSFLSPQELTQALSMGELPPELLKVLRFDRVARLASAMLTGLFAKESKEAVRTRCLVWLDRYLGERFGEPEPVKTPRLDRLRERLEKIGARAD